MFSLSKLISYQDFSTKPNFPYPEIRRPFAIKDQVIPQASRKGTRYTDWPPTSPKCEHIPHQYETVAHKVEDDAWQQETRLHIIRLVKCDWYVNKGSYPERKVQFFLTLFKRPLPLPFCLNICQNLQWVQGVKIWYNVPILPSNFTINASKVPFHANFMLLNDLQNTRQFPT